MSIGTKTATLLAALAVSILTPVSVLQAAEVSPVGVSRDATTPPGGAEQRPPREPALKWAWGYWRDALDPREDDLRYQSRESLGAKRYYLHLGDFSTKQAGMRQIVEIVLEQVTGKDFFHHSVADAHGGALKKIFRAGAAAWVAGNAPGEVATKWDVNAYLAKRRPDFVFVQTEVSLDSGAVRVDTETETALRGYRDACDPALTKLVFLVMPELQYVTVAGADWPQRHARHLASIDREMVRLAVVHQVHFAPTPQAYALLRKRGLSIRWPGEEGDTGHPSPYDSYMFACLAAYTAYLGPGAKLPSLLPSETIYAAANRTITANNERMRRLAKPEDPPKDAIPPLTITDDLQRAIQTAAWESVQSFRARVGWDEQRVATIRGSSDVAVLVAALDDPAARCRREASRRLLALGYKPDETATKRLGVLVTKDPVEETQANALRLLGLGVGEPGRLLLRERLLADMGSYPRGAGLGYLAPALAVPGVAYEPVLLEMLDSQDAIAMRAVLGTVLSLRQGGSTVLRDRLIALLAHRDPGLSGMAGQALLQWPGDATVTKAFETVFQDPASPVYPRAFDYLLPAQTAATRGAFLRQVLTHARGIEQVIPQAITGLIAEAGVDPLREVMNATPAERLGLLADGLWRSCANHKDPAVRAAAVKLIADNLKRADPNTQASMIESLLRFRADAVPALDAIKTIDPGNHQQLTKTRDNAITQLQAHPKK